MKRKLTREWFQKEYWEKQRSTTSIAKELSVYPADVGRFMESLGVPRRTKQEAVARHVLLTTFALETINGQLLGDGHLEYNGYRAASLTFSSKYEDYLAWLFSIFASFGIEQSGRISRYAQKTRNATLFCARTRYYREFIDLRRLWYPEGRKVVPKTLLLTPRLTLHWYLGDGCLNHPKKGRTCIRMHTNALPVEDVEFLASQLTHLGFYARRQPFDNTIYINADSTKAFLQWIGPCPAEIQHRYGYKWDLQHSMHQWLRERR